MQGMLKGPYAACNWTGVGIRLAHDAPVGMTLNFDPTQPAVPFDKLHGPDFFKLTFKFLKKHTKPAHVEMFTKDNWTAVHKVDRVPIKAVVDKSVYPELAARGDDGRTGLQNFFPEKLSPIDIGSNMGFLRLLRQEYDQHVTLPVGQQKYRIIVSDCNIFLRTVKVCHRLES